MPDYLAVPSEFVNPPKWSEPDAEPSAEYFLLKQGDCVRLSKRERAAGPDGVPRGGPRSVVREFSRASRMALLRVLARIDWGLMLAQFGLPVFVTLTYPAEYPVSWERWKANLEAFLNAFERRYGVSCGIWKLEKQRRGAPHYHLVVWCRGSHSVHEMRRWLSAVWYRVVGSGDPRHLRAGTGVEVIESAARLTRYMAKYVEKVEKGGDDVTFDYPVGRYWGVSGRKSLAMAPREVLQFTREGFMALRRVLRRWYAARRRARGGGRYRPAVPRARRDEMYYQGMWALMPGPLIERLVLWGSRAILELDCDDGSFAL